VKRPRAVPSSRAKRSAGAAKGVRPPERGSIYLEGGASERAEAAPASATPGSRLGDCASLRRGEQILAICGARGSIFASLPWLNSRFALSLELARAAGRLAYHTPITIRRQQSIRLLCATRRLRGGNECADFSLASPSSRFSPCPDARRGTRATRAPLEPRENRVPPDRLDPRARQAWSAPLDRKGQKATPALKGRQERRGNPERSVPRDHPDRRVRRGRKGQRARWDRPERPVCKERKANLARRGVQGRRG
jgi:hypothetical protein